MQIGPVYIRFQRPTAYKNHYFFIQDRERCVQVLQQPFDDNEAIADTSILRSKRVLFQDLLKSLHLEMHEGVHPKAAPVAVVSEQTDSVPVCGNVVQASTCLQVCSVLSGLWVGHSTDKRGNRTVWKNTYLQCKFWPAPNA
jgi:hypothetical protein